MRRVSSVLAMCGALIAILTAVPAAARAQAVAFADRGPRFLQAPVAGGTPVEFDASRSALLRRGVSLNVAHATVGSLLASIEAQTGIEFGYSRAVVPVDKAVDLRADKITVAAALTEILLDAHVDVVLAGNNRLMLVKRAANVGRVETGTIVGRVTDGKTGDALVGADVMLEGTRRRTSTGEKGFYTLTDVEAGSYTLVVRRVGYAKQARLVAVAATQQVTVDVALTPVVTQLNEIVTTVTGDQRRLELGHVVGVINADSLVREAPVSSLSELLGGRVPGLQVNPYQGTVGGKVNIQVRSINTINLSAEPIVIVDGVRYTSGHVVRPYTGTVSAIEPTSPLNDINPNTIESIEIAKGPSAATLYGTDAANGVIVITTKRGRPGHARWDGYLKTTRGEIPRLQYPDRYWGWSQEFGPDYNCLADYAVHGWCTQDSVTRFRSPLNDPQLSIFAAKPHWESGARVEGGSADLRYFLAGDYESAIGPLQMPSRMADSMAAARGIDEIPEAQLEPNAFSKINLRSTITLGLRKAAELRGTVGYTRRATRGMGEGSVNPYIASSSYSVTPTRPYGQSYAPEYLFSRTSTERASRLFTSLNARWSTTPWLVVRGTGGLDLNNVTRTSLALRGQAPVSDLYSGAVSDDRGRQLAATAELGATASATRGRLSSRTSIGAQYVRTVDDMLLSSGSDLPPGGSSIGEAANVAASQTYREQVTLGSYVEEVVGLNQRLFLTGALRADGASTFGRNYDVVIYPKAGVSWLLSDEPMLPRIPFVDELRVRYAYGASGQQPKAEWARPGYALVQRVFGGGISNVYTVSTLGNRNLRPERIREHEFGVDASAFHNRIEMGLTWFRRSTVDQIVSISLPPGLGTMWTNIGLTKGHGFEAQIRVRPLESRAVSWDVVLQHSFQTTMLLDLGGAIAQRDPFGGWVEGYPLGARFQRPLLGYNDANGDGVLSTFPAEVIRGDTAEYFGVSAPPRSQTLTNVVSLFGRRLRISALLERRSGFTQLNYAATNLCKYELCREVVDPTTPLAEQAEATAFRQNNYYRIEKGDYTSLREVSIVLDVPPRLTRALRASAATLSLQGRNLKLWSSYSGASPEPAVLSRATTTAEFGMPQSRSWALRFDLGF